MFHCLFPNIYRSVKIVPPKQVVIKDAVTGREFEPNSVAGPYNEGTDVRLTCESAGGKFKFFSSFFVCFFLSVDFVNPATILPSSNHPHSVPLPPLFFLPYSYLAFFVSLLPSIAIIHLQLKLSSAFVLFVCVSGRHRPLFYFALLLFSTFHFKLFFIILSCFSLFYDSGNLWFHFFFYIFFIFAFSVALSIFSGTLF